VRRLQASRGAVVAGSAVDARRVRDDPSEFTAALPRTCPAWCCDRWAGAARRAERQELGGGQGSQPRVSSSRTTRREVARAHADQPLLPAVRRARHNVNQLHTGPSASPTSCGNARARLRRAGSAAGGAAHLDQAKEKSAAGHCNREEYVSHRSDLVRCLDSLETRPANIIGPAVALGLHRRDPCIPTGGGDELSLATAQLIAAMLGKVDARTASTRRPGRDRPARPGLPRRWSKRRLHPSHASPAMIDDGIHLSSPSSRPAPGCPDRPPPFAGRRRARFRPWPGI